MRLTTLHAIRILLIFISMQTIQVQADEIKIAVASNFVHALSSIAQRFEKQTDHTVTLIPGSTGKHYAQIIHGAPYDVFFAADVIRPQRLEQEGVAQPGTRFTYAIGRLIVWSSDKKFMDLNIQELPKQDFNFIAIANPELAPYGRAARQVLQGYKIWEQLKGRMVRGENIGQTFQFVKSGNASLGFVAYSQLKKPHQVIQDSFWLIPQNLYDPIQQQAVLLTNNKAARAFLTYCKSEEALKLIRDYGYHTP